MTYWEKIEASIFMISVSVTFIAITNAVIAWQLIVRNKFRIKDDQLKFEQNLERERKRATKEAIKIAGKKHESV